VVGLIIVCNSLFANPYKNYKVIKNAINNNEILYVSGEVVDFYTPAYKWENHDNESFKINGIEFSFSEYESYGYCKLAVNNGVICHNGQKLRIGYYEEYYYYDKSYPSRRVIVSIEILDDD
jgi:hypothetical protein